MAGKKMIEVTLVKSPIRRPHRQREAVKGLGLRKIGQTVKVAKTDYVVGVCQKHSHLLSWRDVSEGK